METLSIEVKKEQVGDSLDAKLGNNFVVRGMKKISDWVKEAYNNNARYIRGAGRVVLISAVAIAVYKTIDRSDRQAGLTRPAYASSSGRQDLFPYPEYNSGWVDISRGSTITLRHNLGGNVNNYFVDMQFRNILEEMHGFGERRITRSERHNMGIGGDYESNSGAWWSNLTSESIRVKRGNSDPYVDQVRIRIWK